MFERKSLEQIITKMISWTLGSTTRLTDFRAGSRIRTLYEALALTVEELYDRVFRSHRELVENNIYAIVGFEKLPAVPSSGIVTISRVEPADKEYLIPMGTVLLSKETDFHDALNFLTAEDAIILTGETSTEVYAVCSVGGEIGNIMPAMIVDFASKPSGIDAVTNNNAFINGKEEETNEEQKARFQEFLDSQARGDLQSCEYGAKTVKLFNEVTGSVTEQVVDASVIEVLPARKGEIDVYIWNGVGNASANLIAEVRKVLTGYTDTFGNPVYGYKPAGCLLNIYSTAPKNVKVKIVATPHSYTTLDALKPFIESEITQYFASLKMGDTVYLSEVQARVKTIDGMLDVKVSFSEDGGTNYHTNNVTVASTAIGVNQLPVVYG